MAGQFGGGQPTMPGAPPIDRRILSGSDMFQRPFSQIGSPGIRAMTQAPVTY